MKFTATEFRRDGEYGIEVTADSWAEAKRICERQGWRLNGKIAATIPASDTFGEKEADEMVAALNEAEEQIKH